MFTNVDNDNEIVNIHFLYLIDKSEQYTWIKPSIYTYTNIPLQGNDLNFGIF